MAEDFVDIAGRVISATEGLAKDIRDGMQSAVSNVKEFSERDSARNSTLEDIKSLMGQLNQLSTDVSEIKNVVQQSIQMHTTRQKGGPSSRGLKDKPSIQERASTVIDTGTPSGGADQPATEQFSDVAINMYGKDLGEWLKNPTVIVSSLPETKAERQVADEAAYRGLSIPFGASGVHPIPPSGSGGGKGRGRGREGGGLTQTGQKQVMRTIARVTTGLMGVLTAITGGISVSNIFEGVIKEELDYHKIMSRIALQSHGLSGTSATWRDNFRSAGNRLDTVMQTGQKIGKWMQGMVKLQQRGLKNQKFNNKLIKSALNISTMTGIEAEVATEQYANWAQHFHMGNFELATMNVALKDIVRQTGLTGKNLEEAMKTAEGLQRKMKAAGVATRGMLESSIRISAIAQKKGIGDVAGTYTEALSAGFAKFAELPNNIKGALMRFGQGDSQLMEDIMAGRGMQEKNLRKLAAGMKMDTRSVLGIDLLKTDLTKIDSTRMKSLQLMAEKVYGMGIGDLQKMVETMHEGSRTIRERQEEATKKATEDNAALDKQRTSGLITEEQYTKMLADRQKQLDTQIHDLDMTGISKTLNATLGTAAKEGGAAFNKALIDAGGGDMAKGVEKVQSGFATAAQDIENKMRAAVEAGTLQQGAFDQAMKGFDSASITKDLESAMAGGDMGKVVELQQKLLDMQKIADTQGLKGTNIVDSVENNVNNINAMLRDKISDSLIKILTAMGASTIIVTMIGASIVTAIAGLGIIMTTMFGGRFTAHLLKAFKSPFKMILGKGGLRGGKLGGVMIKGAPSSATKAANLGKAGKHFEAAGKEFSKATKGMKDSVVKFGESVKKTKVWTAASNKIDNAAKGLFRAAEATKKRLAPTGARIAQGAGRVKGVLQAGGKRVLGAVDTVAKRGVGAARALKATKVGKGVVKASRALVGVGKAGVMAARGSLLAVKAATSWTVIIPVAISAIEGFAGAMMAGANAAEIFGDKNMEVTERMRMAAEGAGIFTGILDGLTFGLFNKWLGPVGSITIALSKFMHTFWPLALALQAVLLPFKILWGILKGLYLFLKNAFIGLWEGIKTAIEPVVEIFNVLWDAVSEIGGVFMELLQSFGMFGDTSSGLPSIVDTISGALAMLGTALGGVFKAIGFVIKMALTPLVWAVKLLTPPLVWLVKGVLYPLIRVVKAAAKGFIWLYGVVSKIFTEVFAPVMDVFKKLKAVAMSIFGLFSGTSSMKDVGKAIWGAIEGIFGTLPGIIFDSVVDGIKGIGTFMWDTITGALNGLIDWVLSFLPGGKEAAKGFSETSAEQSKTWKEEGATVGHGVGSMGGGIKEIFSGNIMEGGGKLLKGAGETAVGAVKAVGNVVGSIASKLNPLNWFEEGTQKVTNTGLGILHEGEAVIPVNAVNQIAEGNGPFGKIAEWFGGIAKKGLGTIVGGGASKVMDNINPNGGKEPSWIEKLFNFNGENIDNVINGNANMLNPLNWFGGQGEVSVPDKATGETRTMSAEESAEARLARHKMDGQPQQVIAHGTDTESLQKVGLDQINILSQIRDGINKLNSAFGVTGGERVGDGGGVSIGDSSTRYTGNAAALDFGQTPYSAGNEPGMQQVVSQGGVGE